MCGISLLFYNNESEVKKTEGELEACLASSVISSPEDVCSRFLEMGASTNHLGQLLKMHIPGLCSSRLDSGNL